MYYLFICPSLLGCGLVFDDVASCPLSCSLPDFNINTSQLTGTDRPQLSIYYEAGELDQICAIDERGVVYVVDLDWRIIVLNSAIFKLTDLSDLCLTDQSNLK